MVFKEGYGKEKESVYWVFVWLYDLLVIFNRNYKQYVQFIKLMNIINKNSNLWTMKLLKRNMIFR